MLDVLVDVWFSIITVIFLPIVKPCGIVGLVASLVMVILVLSITKYCSLTNLIELNVVILAVNIYILSFFTFVTGKYITSPSVKLPALAI